MVVVGVVVVMVVVVSVVGRVLASVLPVTMGGDVGLRAKSSWWLP